jgi:hypothetical protein
MDQFTIRINLSMFIKGLNSFTMVKMSKFTQNLMKPMINYDAFWYNTWKGLFLSLGELWPQVVQ